MIYLEFGTRRQNLSWESYPWQKMRKLGEKWNFQNPKNVMFQWKGL